MRKNFGYVRVELFLAIAVFIGTGMFAFASRAAVLPLTSQSSAYSIVPFTRLFEDKNKNLSAQNIFAQYKSGAGRTLQGDRVFLGNSSSGFWLVFSVDNRNPAKSRWIFNLGTRTDGAVGIANRLAFFSDAAPDHPLLIDGRQVQNKLQMQGQAKNAIPLMLEPGQSHTFALYIEPASSLPLALAPRMEEQARYQEAREKLSFNDHSLLAGATLLAGIALLFFLIYKTPTPVFLIIYTAAQLVIYRTTDEILSQGNNTSVVYLDIFYAVAGISGLMLAQQVLFSDRQNRPMTDRFITLIMIVIGLTVALGLMTESAATTSLLLRVLPLAVPAFVFVLGLQAVMKRDIPHSLSFTLSWLVLFIGALLTEIGTTGLIPVSTVSLNFYWLCFGPHLLLLAFSSLRFVSTNERNRRYRAVDDARAHEQEMEFRRTKDLTEQNQLLHVLQHEKELIDDLRGREADRLQALRRAKEIADDANKAKSDFLAIISHEIRTPMTGIMGMIRLMEETPMNDKQKEYISTLHYAGDAMLSLLNDILDFSKADVGRMEIESVNFDLKKLVDSVIMLMSARAGEKKIGLKADIAPETPLLLKGDPSRLRQILLNMIGNAIKFTEKGAVTLTIRAHDQTAGKPRISFAITDTGIGISPEAQKNIFTPYKQANASISRRFGGTGLGLSICQKLVNAMGGQIQVDSKMGEGTTFHFVLAFDIGTEEVAVASDAPQEAQPLKILVVDDNAINQRVVMGLLESDKHQMIAVSSAHAAMEEIRKLTFDVILMDMEMPEIDGLAATRMIRKLPDREKASVPIIAMTANVHKEDIARCIKAGMNDYCHKPINRETLRAMLMQVARKEGSFKVEGLVKHAPPKRAYAPVHASPPEEENGETSHVAVNLFNAENLSSLKKSMSREQLNEMMDDLYKKTEELISAAEKAVENADTKSLAARGHEIHGMTGNFGLSALSSLAETMRQQAKNGLPIDKIAKTVQQLRPVYEDTRETINNWIKE